MAVFESQLEEVLLSLEKFNCTKSHMPIKDLKGPLKLCSCKLVKNPLPLIIPSHPIQPIHPTYSTTMLHPSEMALLLL